MPKLLLCSVRVSAFKHKKMEIVKKYKVYELNKVMGSSKHKALEEVEFKGWKSNSFDTEEEAVQAILDDEKTYEDYIILKTVFVCHD